MTRVYIGLGSNLAEPVQQLVDAVNAISALPHTQRVALSSLYQSLPMGPQDQPDYVNAVIAIDCELAPEDLLTQLQTIELQQGRQRLIRWGSRTLDLDILLFGQQQIQTERLTVPHYGLAEREFVVYPLAEIAPQLSLPDGRSLETIKQTCPFNGMQLLTNSAWQQLANFGNS